MKRDCALLLVILTWMMHSILGSSPAQAATTPASPRTPVTVVVPVTVIEVQADQKRNPIAASGIIDRNSRIEVSVSTGPLLQQFAASLPLQQGSSLGELIDKARFLTEAAQIGTKTLEEVIAVVKSPVVTPDAVAAAIRKLATARRPLLDLAKTDLVWRAKLNAAIQAVNSAPSDDKPARVSDAIFSAAADYAESIGLQIASMLSEYKFRVTGRLTLLRDTNPSLTSDVSILAGLNDDQMQYAHMLGQEWSGIVDDINHVRQQGLGGALPTTRLSLDDIITPLTQIQNNLTLLSGKLTPQLNAEIDQALKALAAKNVDDLRALNRQLAGLDLSESAVAVNSMLSVALQLQTALDSIRQIIPSLCAVLPNLLKTDAIGLDPEQTAALNALKQSLSVESGSVFEAALTKVATGIHLLSTASSLSKIGALVRIGEQLQDVTVDPSKPFVVIAFDNHFPNDGGSDSPRSRDRLHLIVTAPLATQGRSLTIVDTELVAYTIGWRTDMSIIAALYPTEGKPTTWRPSVAVSYLFKQAGRTSIDANETWAAGWGFSTLVLDQDNNSQVEIGIAPCVSLFNDILQGGFGFNFTRDHSFGWVGIRLPIKQ